MELLINELKLKLAAAEKKKNELEGELIIESALKRAVERRNLQLVEENENLLNKLKEKEAQIKTLRDLVYKYLAMIKDINGTLKNLVENVDKALD